MIKKILNNIDIFGLLIILSIICWLVYGFETNKNHPFSYKSSNIYSYTVFTACIVHGGWFHICMNVMGSISIYKYVQPSTSIKTHLISILASALIFYILLALIYTNEHHTIVGLSGVIYFHFGRYIYLTRKYNSLINKLQIKIDDYLVLFLVLYSAVAILFFNSTSEVIHMGTFVIGFVYCIVFEIDILKKVKYYLLHQK